MRVAALSRADGGASSFPEQRGRGPWHGRCEITSGRPTGFQVRRPASCSGARCRGDVTDRDGCPPPLAFGQRLTARPGAAGSLTYDCREPVQACSQALKRVSTPVEQSGDNIPAMLWSGVLIVHMWKTSVDERIRMRSRIRTERTVELRIGLDRHDHSWRGGHVSDRRRRRPWEASCFT